MEAIATAKSRSRAASKCASLVPVHVYPKLRSVLAYEDGADDVYWPFVSGFDNDLVLSTAKLPTLLWQTGGFRFVILPSHFTSDARPPLSPIYADHRLLRLFCFRSLAFALTFLVPVARADRLPPSLPLTLPTLPS
ncbi:hypothetical protein K438DRAFT_1990519 [Mycena galopus ATCC 62051]|nr:hypothetical protein K438DRAFT_2000476 [Mycena galopus ATCC 62051]KAF8146604.1 hypothetical protein K438DRAFT_1990519 [Mycena galopus ATCC 62051]